MNKVYFPNRMTQAFLVLLVCGQCSMLSASARARVAPSGNEISFRQTVKGTIKDAASGRPLGGATIGVKGASQTATSDDNGAFTINVPDNATSLMVSYVGYVTQEVPIAGKTTVDILMQTLSTDLSQVVVVGYGTQSRKDVTGATKTLKSAEFNKGIINAPQELLQGKMAGVNVTSASGEPGGMLGITVRGPGGMRVNNTPLFIVDGLPLDNSSTGGGDPLNFLNPQDIESIDVLKDASATAIYGSRGANGVILITTRKGKAGASTLGFSAGVGFSTIARALPVYSASEFRKQVVNVGGLLDDQGGDTDWQKEITRTAITQNYNLNLSGGADKLSYYASFGMQKQQGVLKNNDMDRYSGRFNATQKFWDDALVIEANLGVANTKNQRPPIGTMIGDAIANNPTYPAYDASGEPAKYQNMNNPLVTLALEDDITTINRVTGNITPSLRIIKGLVYKLNFGIDNSSSTRDIVSRPNAVPQRDGRLETWNVYNRNTLIENYLTYNFDKGAHSFLVLGGYSYQKFFQQGRNTSINKFPITPVDPIYNPGLGQELTLAANKPGGFAIENELQSYFARINYGFDDRYLLTINFRADGSTKFGENNKYGYFPSFSAGWRISEEKWMKGSFFSNLKLRAGWGATGNQEIPPKLTQALYTTSVSAGTSYPLYPTGAYPGGTTFTRLANPDLQWETSKQTNVGLDFGFLGGALSGSIDAFRKVTSNMLLRVVVADPIQPSSDTYINNKNAQVVNQGLELDLEYNYKSTGGMNFNLGGNLTLLQNELRNSPYTVIPSGSASGAGLTSATINGYVNGESLGTFFLKEWTGFDKDGLSTYRDVDGDGIVSDKDRIAAGTALPKVMYSFHASVAYKGFDLLANFNGVGGNKVYDNTANANFYKLRLSKSVNTTPEAVQYPEESVNNAAPVSTRYLKNGSFLRLNNLTLGYNFNTRALGISKYASMLRLSVTGQNLFVITKYDGYDPEVNTDRTIDNFTSYGVDYLSYPKAKSIIFNLNVSF
ncbi:SusC/RagA family TonB-linked outer membrane protein [Chitinophaga sp. GCM10012297]|uniref:TonB-dependent receptor n=1 Tax=Chitinophaga chungangae TaxID=2821488 RepID=A0ABS3YH20_9BACT|nr:TonB-dependent receptor [Chitinophaga chungangae]MBO9153992.1 TonB-dependent receptor [Chitinophaga chungangae]